MITPSIVANRTSGIAPLGVILNAGGTTSSESVPWKDLAYRWTYALVSPGAYTTGKRTGAGSKNVSYGPIGRMWFPPGTYLVTLDVVGLNEPMASTSIVITAHDPEHADDGYDEFHYFSTDTNFAAGTPAHGALGGRVFRHENAAWADLVTEATSDDGISKEMSLEYGDAWTPAGALACTLDGPRSITANRYGSGTKPDIAFAGSHFILGHYSGGTTNNADCPDWRFVNLGLRNTTGASNNDNAFQAQGPFRQCTVIGCDIDGHGLAFDFNTGFLDTLNSSVPLTYPNWSEFCVADCTFDVWKYYFIGSCDKIAVFGNHFQGIPTTSDGHGLRLYSQVGCINNNTLDGPMASAGGGGASIALRGFAWAGTNTIPANTFMPYQFLVNENVVDESSGGGVFCITARYAAGVEAGARGRYVLIENNRIIPPPGTLEPIHIDCSYSAVRNNRFSLDRVGTTGAGVIIITRDTVNHPADVNTDIDVVNNTLHAADTRGSQNVNVVFISGSAAPQNLRHKNNLSYFPNWTPLTQHNDLDGDSPGAGSSISNNTDGADIRTLNPNFVSATPSSDEDFKLTGSSYGVGGGATVPNPYDYFFTSRKSVTNDMGFAQYNAGEELFPARGVPKLRVVSGGLRW